MGLGCYFCIFLWNSRVTVIASLKQFHAFIQGEPVFLIAAVCKENLLCIFKEGRFPSGTRSLNHMIGSGTDQVIEADGTHDAAYSDQDAEDQEHPVICMDAVLYKKRAKWNPPCPDAYSFLASCRVSRRQKAAWSI